MELASKTVLLLEDEPFISLAVEEDLQDAGATVISTKTCEEALKVVKSRLVDAALLDLHIGDRDCRKVAELLHGKGVPFIVSTGDAHADDFGARFKLIKPYRPEELVKAMKVVCSSEQN